MNTLQNVSLADALGHLRRVDDVFVRMSLAVDDAGHNVLRSLVIDVLPQQWIRGTDSVLLAPWLQDQRVFEGGNAFFYCGTLATSTVLGWFTRPADCSIGGFDHRRGHTTRIERFSLPEVHDNVSEIRSPSYALTGAKAIPYPSTLYTFTPKAPRYVQNRDSYPLVGEEGDYFPSFRLAQAELIFGVTEHNQAYMRDDLIAIRVVDARGWLKQVRLLPDKAIVTIAGTDAVGKSFVAVKGPRVDAKGPVMNHRATLALPPQITGQVEVALLGSGEVLDTAYFTGLDYPIPHRSPQVVVEREDVVGYVRPDEPPAATITETYSPSEVVARAAEGKVRAKAFISYSHDSPEHRKRVLELANRLRREGVDCHLDQYVQAPSEGWPRWMQGQIEWADFVLVVCTDTYCRRFNDKEEPGKGLGVGWEGLIITQTMYDQAGSNDKFVPVIFSAVDVKHVPVPLQPTTRYNVADERGYEDLYARLTGQTLVDMPPLGEVKKLSPRDD